MRHQSRTFESAAYLWLNTVMDPQNPYGPAQPPGNPYDFIMSPDSAPRQKPKLVPGMGGGNSFAKKLAVLIGGAIVVVIILAVGVTLLTGGKTNSSELVELAETQAELIRVSGEGLQNATGQDAKNAATTINLGLQTQQTQLLNLLGQRGQKIKPKELALKQNPTTDKQLMLAQQTSTYDDAFMQIIHQQLSDYVNTLSQLYTKSTDSTVRKQLQTDYNQAQLMLIVAPDTTDNN